MTEVQRLLPTSELFMLTMNWWRLSNTSHGWCSLITHFIANSCTFLLLRITYFCTVWLSLCLGKQLTFAVLNAYIPTLCTAMMPPSESRPILGWLAEVYVHLIDLSVANCTCSYVGSNLKTDGQLFIVTHQSIKANNTIICWNLVVHTISILN